MGSSIRTPLFLASGVAMLVLAGLTVTLSTISLRSEIEQLDRRDYSERIHNFEYDYRQVDAVSAATDEVQRVQQELLQDLQERYVGFEDARAQPFIVNGDGEVILYLPESGIDQDALADAVLSSVDPDPARDQEFAVDRGGYSGWAIVSYYAPWDWYTGYTMTNATRFAGLVRLLTGLSVAVAAGALVLFLVFGTILNRLLRPVRPIEQALATAQQGDLTVRLGSTGRRELGRIARAVDAVMDQFSHMIDRISEGSKDTVETGRRLRTFADGTLETFRGIGTSTRAIAGGMGQLNARVEDSTTRIGGIADHVGGLKEAVEAEDATISDLSAAVDAMGETLEQTLTRTRDAGTSVERLQEVSRTSVESLVQSGTLMQDAASRVEALNEFIELIHAIAEQTGLLAMNAAIEAANAGEAGKGFAVVADEIQRLATSAEENSESIASVLRALVASIQEASRISRSSDETLTRFDREIGTVSASLAAIADETQMLEQRHREMVERLETLSRSSSHTREEAGSVDGEAQEIRTLLGDIQRLSHSMQEQIDAIDRQAEETQSQIDHAQTLIASVTDGAESLEERVKLFRTSTQEPSTVERSERLERSERSEEA